MNYSNKNLENVIGLFNEDLSTHPLLNSYEGKPDLFYADLYFFIKGNELDESDIKLGLSLELIALSYKLHFGKKNISSLDLIEGDYFYARALKRTVETGDINAVKVLSKAVSREADIRSLGFDSDIFPSLIAAACELSVFKGRPPEVVKTLLKEFFEKKMRGFGGSKSYAEAVRFLKEWGWFE